MSHKNKTKTVVGVTVGVAVLVAVVGVAGWLTKGFKSTDVLDVTKKGTVVAMYDDLDELYTNTSIYYERYTVGEGEETKIMLGTSTVYQVDQGTIDEAVWKKINIDGVANSRTVAGPNNTFTVVEKGTEGSIPYFDTVRVNYRAHTNYYLEATSAADVIASKESKNVYVASYFEIPIAALEFEEKPELNTSFGNTYDLCLYGLAGVIPSLEFISIEFVNTSGLYNDLALMIAGD